MQSAVHASAHAGQSPLVLLDEDGFLVDHTNWTRALAQQIAQARGLGTLEESQWTVIEYVRQRYFELGAMPPLRMLCRKLGVDPMRIKAQFGSCRCLLQVAGLPNPGGEVLAYLP